MKATVLTATAVLLALTTFGSDARADHSPWRALDDLTYDALGHARDVRWEIHDHFAGSRDYEPLLADAHKLTHALREIEDAIEHERSPRAIVRLVDATHDVLLHLKEHADHSEFAQTVPGGVSYERGRIRYRAQTRHAGYVYVEELKSQLRHIDEVLHSIEEELSRMDRRQHHDHDVDHGPGPRVPYFEGPAVPGLPPRSTFIPPGSSSAAHDVPAPLVRHRGGDVWLRLLLN